MIKPIKIMIYITDKCNMKCSYCYNKFPRNNIDINIHLLLKYIDDVYKKTSRIIDIMLVGGEPSLHNDIIMFIKECRTRDFINVIDVFTNFSNDLFFYKTLIKNKINLVCSWHDETNDEMFIKNLNSLTKNERKFIVEIAMMFEHKNICRWINVITKIIGNYKNVIQPWILFNKYDIMEYSQSQKNEFIKILMKLGRLSLSEFRTKNAVNRIFNQYCDKFQESFLNKTCSAGYDMLYIHNNGDVYKCHNDYAYNLPILYNITENNSKFDMNFYKSYKCICNCCRHENIGVTIQ